jgi:hypothetical protein
MTPKATPMYELKQELVFFLELSREILKYWEKLYIM